MQAYTYRLIDNGRELDNTTPTFHATAEEAKEAGDKALDDVCPRLSSARRFYRVETYSSPIHFSHMPIYLDDVGTRTVPADLRRAVTAAIRCTPEQLLALANDSTISDTIEEACLEELRKQYADDAEMTKALGFLSISCCATGD